MNRLEMAAKLFENPKLKAKNNLNEIVRVFKYGKTDLMEIEYESTGEVLNLSISDETWEIIEPEKKLKEFCFGEMVYHWQNNENIRAENCKSIVSKMKYDRGQAQLTLDELKGKWTIVGYYEEDENE